jgi:hypothetical protein
MSYRLKSSILSISIMWATGPLRHILDNTSTINKVMHAKPSVIRMKWLPKPRIRVRV